MTLSKRPAWALALSLTGVAACSTSAHHDSQEAPATATPHFARHYGEAFEPRRMTRHGDRTFVIGGISDPAGDPEVHDAWMAELDEAGAIVRQHRVGEPGADETYGDAAADDDSLWTVGSIRVDDPDRPDGPRRSATAFVHRHHADGSVTQVTVASKDGHWTTLTRVVPHIDGGAYAIGNMSDGERVHGIAMKLNHELQVVWQHTYAGYRLNAVRPLADGRLALAGAGPTSSSGMALLVLDDDGATQIERHWHNKTMWFEEATSLTEVNGALLLGGEGFYPAANPWAPTHPHKRLVGLVVQAPLSELGDARSGTRRQIVDMNHENASVEDLVVRSDGMLMAVGRSYPRGEWEMRTMWVSPVGSIGEPNATGVMETTVAFDDHLRHLITDGQTISAVGSSRGGALGMALVTSPEAASCTASRALEVERVLLYSRVVNEPVQPAKAELVITSDEMEVTPMDPEFGEPQLLCEAATS